MKRIFALLLCFVMTATIFAGCQKPEESQEPKGVFEAGYGRVDITPDPAHSYPLGGWGDGRPSREIWDDIYVTCTAMKDENGDIYLLYHCDFLKVHPALNMAKNQISKATGVPMNNIIVSTTHSHSSPDLGQKGAIIEDYATIVKKAMVKAGEDAVADLKPAKIYTTEIVCEGFNAIRTVCDDDLDNTMELIKFTREGGKDIVMMNWQGHPIGQGADMTAMICDVDIIRKNLESALDCNFVFFLGASGNVQNKNTTGGTYVDHYNALAAKAVEAAASFKEVTDGVIKKVTTKVTLETKNGSGTEEVSIYVVSVGNSLAFAIVPYEMFSNSALELKAYSKFDQTFIVTCAEGHIGYLPTLSTVENEYELNATSYAKGSAEKLVDGYKTLFDQLQN